VDSRDLGRLYDHLLAGDAAAVAALFAGAPRLHTSMDGTVEGEAALADYVGRMRDKLAARNARVEPVAGFETAERAVVEIAVPMDDTERPVPVAIVGDRDGEAFSAIRVYYNVFMVEHDDFAPPPVLTPPDQALDLPPAVAAYLAVVRDDPNPEAAAAMFGDKGYFVAATGHRRNGARMTEQLFDLFLRMGGMFYQPCLVTTRGAQCAVEWMCTRWGTKEFAPQNGVAVFETAGDKDLAAARFYDDLKPPFLPDFRR
jgi:hypothetical protein